MCIRRLFARSVWDTGQSKSRKANVKKKIPPGVLYFTQPLRRNGSVRTAFHPSTAMKYYTTLNEKDLAALADRKSIKAGQTYSDFKMDYPLQLKYITLHPADRENYFTMISIAPDRYYRATLPYEDLAERFSKKQLHRHSYYELLYVLGGTVYQIIENERHLYTPGSCCLLNKNILHTEEHETDFSVAFLGISDAVLADVYRDLTDGFFRIEKERPRTDLDRFLEESLSRSIYYEKKYVDFIPKKENMQIIKETSHIISVIDDELQHPRIGSSHMIKAMLAKLLHLLSDPDNYETVPIAIGTDAESLLYNQIDQIMRATCGRATRSFLESELHYSGGYLNKITKKYTGLSIHDFGMTVCMEQAAKELLHSTRSIGEIAAELGFSNRTHFYKQFEKVYHTLPGEFRKDFSQNNTPTAE